MAYDGQQDITSEVTWSWDFDDGSAADTDNPTEHAYETAGNYTVTVTATWSAQQAQDQLQADAQEPTGNYVLARQLAGGGYITVTGSEICHRRFIIAFDDQDVYDWVAFACRCAGAQEYGDPTYVYRHEAQQITLDGQQRDHAFIHQWATDEAPGQAAAGWHNGVVDWHIEASYLDWEMEEVFEVVGEDTWTISNTVVGSSGGVLCYDPDDENLDECVIPWTTSHLDGNGVKFRVPIAIYDLAGNLLYTHVEEDVELGTKSWPWNGTIFEQEPEGPTQAPKGIYTYTVGVVGSPGTCGGVRCSCPTISEGCQRGDWDKSAFLQISNVSHTDFAWEDAPTRASVILHYTLSTEAAACALTVYRPDLSVTTIYVPTGGALPTGSGAHNQSVEFEVDPTVLGSYYFVVSATEGNVDAAKNRDRSAKPARQMGVNQTILPIAFNFTGGGAAYWEADGEAADTASQQGKWPTPEDEDAHEYEAPPYAAVVSQRPAAQTVFNRWVQGMEDEVAPDAVVVFYGHGYILPDDTHEWPENPPPDPDPPDFSQVGLSAAANAHLLRGGRSADSPQNDEENDIYYMCNLPAGALQHCRLVTLFACHSAHHTALEEDWDDLAEDWGEDPSTCGCLCHAALAKGAGCVIGFQHRCAYPYGWQWGKIFWRIANRDGYTVNTTEYLTQQLFEMNFEGQLTEGQWASIADRFVEGEPDSVRMRPAAWED